MYDMFVDTIVIDTTNLYLVQLLSAFSAVTIE